MVFLIIEIYNYHQITKINSDVADTLDETFDTLKQKYSCDFSQRKENIFLFTVGQKKIINPIQTVQCLEFLKTMFTSINEFLIGFSVLMVNSSSEIFSLLLETFFAQEIENEVVIDEDCKGIIGEFSYLVKINEHFWKYTGLKKNVNSISDFINAAFPWMRNNVYDLLLALYSKYYNSLKIKGLLLCSQPNIGLESTIKNLFHAVTKLDSSNLPVLYTLYKRQSPIHPILNSINIDLFSQFEIFLSKNELILWEELKELIYFLKNQKVKPKCVDHLLIDFKNIFFLYTKAYLKYMESLNSPGIIAYYNIEFYHPDCQKIIIDQINSFRNYPNFFPILISTDVHFSSTIKKIKLKKINIWPCSAREIKAFSKILYPGINIPRSFIKILSRSASGNTVTLFHYLLNLKYYAKIIKIKEVFQWQSKKEVYISLPIDIKVLAINVLKNLDKVKLENLYIVCLSSGLLQKNDYFEFVELLNYEIKIVEENLSVLYSYGFISETEPFISLIPNLTAFFEKKLDSRAEFIREKLIKYLYSKWKSGYYNHNVLLYYFYIKQSQFSYASDILPIIITQRIEEENFTALKIFFELKNIPLKTLDSALVEKFKTISITGRLHFSILRGNIKESEKIASFINNNLRMIKPSRERGNLLVILSLFYFRMNQIEQAIKISTRAVMELQESGSKEDLTIVYIHLSLFLMTANRVDESLEYLSLAERSIKSDTFSLLRCVILNSVLNFILGHFSKIHISLNHGMQISKNLNKRKWQIYVIFFMGRLEFALGNYPAACEYFQRALTDITLYSYTEARQTVYAWLARTWVYLFNFEMAVKILKSLEPTEEVLFFLAEAYFMLKKYKNSFTCVNEAVNVIEKKVYIQNSDEILDWKNGFNLIEARFFLPDYFFHNLLKNSLIAFRGLIQSKLRKKENSIKDFELSEIKADRNIHLPYLIQYNLFYYLSIPGIQNSELNVKDRMTLLNKAFAYLQEQANRIDSVSDRNIYLNTNYWNNILFNEAKKFKII